MLMKTSRSALICVLILTALRGVSISGELKDDWAFDVDYPKEWSMHDGQHIVFVREKRHDIIKTDKEHALIALPGTELVQQIVQSKNKQFLLCQIYAYRQDEIVESSDGKMDGGVGFDYVCLAIISKPDSKWSIKRLMTKEDLGAVGVSEIGAISDDGKRALLKVARETTPGSSIQYVWETWDLQSMKVIKEGLSVE